MPDYAIPAPDDKPARSQYAVPAPDDLPSPRRMAAPSMPEDQWTSKTDAWGDTPDPRTPNPGGLFGPDYMGKMLSDPNTKWTQSQYGFKTVPMDVSAINPKIGKTVLREDGAIWDNSQKRWVKMNQADLKTSPASPGVTPQSTEQVGDGGFGTSIMDKLNAVKDRQMAKQKRLVDMPWSDVPQELMSTVGNMGINVMNPGTLVKNIRNQFTDKPLGIEKYLPDPTFAGVAKGLADIPVGTGQLMAHAGSALGIPGAQDNAKAMDQAAKESQDYYNQNYDPSTTGELVGQSLPFLATGGASGGAQIPQKVNSLLQALKIGGQRAGEGVLIGAMQPDPQAATDNRYTGRAIGRAMGGATMGVAAPLVGQGLGYLGGKTADALAGTTLGNKMGIPTELKPQFAGAPEMFRDLQGRGEMPTVGGVTGDPVLLAEQARFQGNSPKMATYNQQGAQAALADAEGIASGFQGGVNTTNWKNLDQVKALALGNTPRSAKAREVLQMIQESGVNNPSVSQASGQLELLNHKIKADQLSNKLQAVADPLGDVPHAQNISDSVGAVIDRMSTNTASSLETRNFLQRIKGGIDRALVDNAPKQGATIDPLTQEITFPRAQAAPQGDVQDIKFGGLRGLLTEVNSKIKSLVGSQVSPSNSELVPLQETASAIKGAMDDFAQQGPEKLQEAWSAFNNHYRANVVPYKDTRFGGALSSEDPFKGENIFKGGNEQEQARYFGLLGERGQAAVKANILNNLVTASTVPAQGVGPRTLDPGKLADGLRKLSENGTLDVVFKGSERASVEKLWQAMQAVGEGGTRFSAQPNVAERTYPTTYGIIHQMIRGGWDKLNEGRMMDLYTNPESRLMLQRKQSEGPSDILTLLRNFGKTPQDIANTQ